jgi:excinuclease ABC subunit A
MKKKLKPFEGIIPFAAAVCRSGTSAEKKNLSDYMADSPCTHCQGSRLRKESRHITIDGKSVGDLTARSITDLQRFFNAYRPDGKRGVISEKIIKEIAARLAFLMMWAFPI